MTQRMFVMNETTRAIVERVRAFAEDERNRYRPTEDEFRDPYAQGNPLRPGNRPEHKAVIGSYHCVYSITDLGVAIVKELSVKTPAAPPDTAPDPAMVAVIAAFWGFTGPRNWQVEIDRCRPACADREVPLQVVTTIRPRATMARGRGRA